MKGKFILLGTGASPGTPVISCKCAVCMSDLRYNKRLRPSALVKINKKNILIDVGPDFRYQALKHNINSIDSLIITHVHFDHIAGLDDLRIFNRQMNRALDCYLLKPAYRDIKKRFEYLFYKKQKKILTTCAKFDFHILKNDFGSFHIKDLSIDYFSFFQDRKKVLGLRFGNIAYVTDIKKYDDSIFEDLAGLDTLILSCLRYKRSKVHFNVNEAVKFAQKVNAKKTFLTHMAHEIKHEELTKELPDGIKPGYDGQEIKFEM